MRAAAGLPLLGAAGALLTATLFFGGGSGDGRLFWIGAFALLTAFACVGGGLGGLVARPAPTRLGVAALWLLAAFVLWNGLTMAWSITPDRSWTYLNRGLVYVAFAIIGLFLAAAARRPTPLVAGALALLLGAVVAWALAGKVIPGLFPDGARVARLRSPIGYWNALALVCAIALPVFLWLAPRQRALAALGVYLSVVALLLTYSRGGVAVAIVAVALWLAAGVSRSESLGALGASLPVALGVAGIGLALPGVAKDLQPQSVRVADGAWFGLALVVGAALVGWLASRHLGRRELQGLGALAVVLVAVGIGALIARGDWLAGFRGSDAAQVPQSANRLTSASSNNRWSWWKEAWQLFENDPVGGTGARSFRIARGAVRETPTITNEPHNVALQFLAETGIVGLLLGAAAALAALAAAWQTVGRLRGDERGAATALAIALPVYLLHALADIDWDFVAPTALLFLLVGVLVGAASEPRPPPRRPALAPAAIAGAVCLAALYSLTAPWLADRRVDDALAAISRGDPAAAVSAAREAHELDPFSIDALLYWALAAEAADDPAAALRRFEQRTRLQPENADTWYDLGAYQFKLGRYMDAYVTLNHAYGLDPYGAAGVRGGLLDQARAKVEGRD
jgi:tetratricopeptide (TPR) repeat protein